MYFADGIKLSCLLLCTTLLVIVQNSTCSPWTDPCGGASVVPGTEGNGGTTSNLNITTALANIANSATRASSHALMLQQLYINRTRVQPALLRGFYLSSFPVIRENITNVSAALQRDYDDVATMVVFMEQVLDDERHDTNTALNFTSDMSGFQTALTVTLCKIKMAADANSQILALNVTRDVMPDVIRNMANRADRYKRDFIIFRDAKTYLTGLSGGY